MNLDMRQDVYCYYTMDQLADLLKSKQPQEPPQIRALRAYIQDHHAAASNVSVSSMGYTVTITDASLATILRMEMPAIQQACHLDKKLFIRIGPVS